jgi:hypothetical protein
MPSLAERIATATTKLDTERTAENLSNAAILQRIAGNTTEALQLLQELVEQRTNGNTNAAAPLLTAQALLDLGSLQRSIGDAPQARLSLEKAWHCNKHTIQRQPRSPTFFSFYPQSLQTNNCGCKV